MSNLSNQQFENLLLKSFEQLDRVKETCKVTVSQCLQSNNLSKVNPLIKSCLETSDTSDLCKMFIINRSPNIKPCLEFTLKVLQTTTSECNKVKNDPLCKDTIKFCSKIVTETSTTLKKLHQTL